MKREHKHRVTNTTEKNKKKKTNNINKNNP